MRIAFIGQKSFVMGDRGGGIERHVTALATRLAHLGHFVTVYARRRYTAEHPSVLEGVHIRYPWTIYTKHLEAIVHVLFSTLDVLFRKIDVVHYHGVGPALLCWLPKLLRPSVRVVVTFHAQDRYHQKWGAIARGLLALGEWMACHIPHQTIVVSHELQVVCRERYHADTVLIPNGASRRVVRGYKKLQRMDLRRGEYILSVGRLLPVKGIHHLIKAFRKLTTRKKLAIVGPFIDKKYERTLRHLASGDPRIVFLGFKSGESLAQLYANAYLFVQPSESEGLSLSVLDAMSYGTAVLVSDIPGNVEAIHHAGFTFESADVKDLGQKLNYLLKNVVDVKKSGRESRRVVETYFDWDEIVEQTLMVYGVARVSYA